MAHMRLAQRVDASQVAIAAAGGIEPLIALLGSPSVGVQVAAAGALLNLAWKNGVCRGGGGGRGRVREARGALLTRAVPQSRTRSRSLLRTASIR